MREVVWAAGCVSPASPGEVLRCGELEKRSGSLWQTWKRKRVVLSRESLSLFPPTDDEEEESPARKARGPREGKAKGKALGLGSIAKVDCVERTGKYLYFTLVTTDRREIDFRCLCTASGGVSPGWNASIALALIDFQNQRALRRFRESRSRNHRHGAPTEEESPEEEDGYPPPRLLS